MVARRIQNFVTLKLSRLDADSLLPILIASLQTVRFVGVRLASD
jgi:hypothetical protein